MHFDVNMKIVSTIFYSFFIILLLGIAGLFLAPLLPLEKNVSVKIVESGSMEPAIMTGSLVVVFPTGNYGVGDVITFESASADVPTTHRITNIQSENGQVLYTTKGDANEEIDTNLVNETSVIGEIILTVPQAGFILDFARQPMGFALLIVLPALMIIMGEIEKIWSEIRRKKGGDGGNEATVTAEVTVPEVPATKTPVRMIEIGRPVPTRTREVVAISHIQKKPSVRIPFGEVVAMLLIALASISFVNLNSIGATVSFLNDVEDSLANELIANELDFAVAPDETVFSFLGSELDDEDGAVVSVFTPTPESVGVAYTIENIAVVAGDVPFCEVIQASSVAPVVYSGPLTNLLGTGIVFTEPWMLSLSLPENYDPEIIDKVCEIEILLIGWNESEISGEGYFDEEVINLMFTGPAVEAGALEAPLFKSFSAPEGGASAEPEAMTETEIPADIETPAETNEEITEAPEIEEAEEATEVETEEEEAEEVEETEEAPEVDTENEEIAP